MTVFGEEVCSASTFLDVDGRFISASLLSSSVDEL